ncbi:MAG TPA: hypothetical protein VMA83_08570 [Solirubrobacteraceae bacterium]|nr:hypothetical protein [Solirubrobacteraceae bacterium]HUB74701.1 hypothetical protein [Solirubrobacteraceae bacterium]
MAETSANTRGPAGALETYPLIIGVVGISIPVGLVTAAAVTESVALLVLAVLALFMVGAATLGFVLHLASDPPEPADEGEAHAG